MERISQLQASRNAETLDGWNRFAPHRERVAQLLLDAASPGQANLCVLGAGNCNDLALSQLAQAFRCIDLVDIDEQAIVHGMACQGITAGQVTVHGSVDVTGVAKLMSAWKPETPARDEQIDACIAAARRAVLPFDAGGYSVVASVGLLSQLVEATAFALGERHARFVDLMTCIRREHLRLLTDLASPGGAIVLITDVVSSQTLPELATAASDELPGIVGRAIAQRNFFSGMNPFVIKRLLETEPPFATQLVDLRLTNPWVWDLGPRLYAVVALTAKRV